jgi:F-type H+-transporting ATPase subunit delta
MARAGTTNARRYAEAVFEIARRDGTVEEWLAQLDHVAAALADAAIVRRLENPRVPLPARHAALISIFERQPLPQLSNLLGLVLRRRRLEALPHIAREFRRLYNRQAGIVEATATSAARLEPNEVAALRARLEQMTGGRVELSLHVDPQLLGGVQVRLGDQLIDGSVRGRLERLRGRLAAGSLTS